MQHFFGLRPAGRRVPGWRGRRESDSQVFCHTNQVHAQWRVMEKHSCHIKVSEPSVAILAQVVDIRRGFLRLGALSGAILSKRTRFILSSLVFCVLDSGCRLRRYLCRNSMSPSLEASLELWLNHTRCLRVGNFVKQLASIFGLCDVLLA